MNFVSQINTNSRILSNSAKSSPNVADELKKFKELLDSGAINQEEFEMQKTKLLK